MTGRRLHIILSPETDLLLSKAVKSGGATRTAVVEAALRAMLDCNSEERDLEKLISRLNKLTRAMERLADDATAQTESFALFILHYLSVTPPLPESMRAGAEALGRKRFEEFVSEVASRLLGRDRFADALLARIDLVRSEGDNEESAEIEETNKSSNDIASKKLNGVASESRAFHAEARS